MVTQEGSHSSNEDGRDREQDRKSLAAAAIRRGEIKISEPILWVEGVPDASSVQHAGPSIVPPERTGKSEGLPTGDETHGIAVSTHEEHEYSAPQPIGDAPPLDPQRSSQWTGRSRNSPRVTTPIDQLMVQRSSFAETSPATSGQMGVKKQRRSGTIRTVFRKVFGRRDKSISKHISPPESRAGPKHEYTRSDPFPSMSSKSPDSKRDDQPKDSLRIQTIDEEYTSKPHIPPPKLPFPMNVNAPASPAHSSSNYISFETSPKVHRRRATLPSLVLSAADAAVLQKMWNNSDIHPQFPSKSLKHTTPSPLIGVAVTSSANPNRRSRSAGALHELARAQGESAGLRRRSSEIRFWRTSRIDSQAAGRPQTKPSSDYESSKANSLVSSRPSVTELSDALADTGSSTRGGPHSFDFGSITTETNTAERQVHIVEQRLSQLEYNMQHISLSLQEFTAQPPERGVVAVGKVPPMHGKTNSIGHRSQNSLTLDRPGLPANPKDTKRFTQASQAPPVRSASPTSPKVTQHAATFLASPSSADASAPLGFTAPAQGQSPRPSTSAGIQGQQPVLPATLPSSSIYDHLAPLYNALRYERSVRKNLETQVLQLRKDVLDLNTVVNQLRGASFTPSPDTNIMREKSRFSGYDSDEESKVAGIVSPEKWATPKEELAPKGWESNEGHMF